MMGEVFSVNISHKKGTSKREVPEVVAVENCGIKGDAHFGFSHRQISLLSWEEIERQNAYLKEKKIYNFNLKPGDFAENLTTKGLDLSKLEVGDRMRIGEKVLLEVTQIGKECHDLCEISKKIGKCIMPKKGIFTRVLKGGRIKKGDFIVVIKKDEDSCCHGK